MSCLFKRFFDKSEKECRDCKKKEQKLYKCKGCYKKILCEGCKKNKFCKECEEEIKQYNERYEAKMKYLKKVEKYENYGLAGGKLEDYIKERPVYF